MRIIATSDLHYNIPRSRGPTEAIAADICRAGGDILLLLGDLCGTDLTVLEHAFALFDGFRGAKLYVPGNHELWVAAGDDSLARFRQDLPALCRRSGVHPLDESPFVAGDVAVCGTIGWYDYTFRPAALGIPLRFYQHKLAPGSASIRPQFQHLVNGRDDIPAPARDIVCRWMDGEHVRMELSDREFTELTASALRSQLQSVAQSPRVAVGMHCLPFVELVPERSHSRSFQFATAFLGSELFGEMVLEFANVRRLLCGHNHHRAECRRGELYATAIGSTYTHKRFEIVDV